MIYHISPSSGDRLGYCEYVYFCSSILRIEPRAARPWYMDRGTLFHALIEFAEHHYAQHNHVFAFEGKLGEKAAKGVFAQVFEKRGVSCDEDTYRALLAAARYHIPRLGLEDWETATINGEPVIELSLTAPLGKFELHATIDYAFTHRKTGRRWHTNWKTTAKPVHPDTHVTHHQQLFIERYILEHNGFAPDVSALCKLRSVAPEPPPLVYKGGPNQRPSKDMSKLTCTWEQYAEALIDCGNDPSDPEYAELREKIETQLFVRWLPDATSPTAEAEMLLNLLSWLERAAEIQSWWAQRAESGISSLRAPRRSLGYGCFKCQYRSWCHASMEHPEGLDLSLLGADYKLRDKHSPLVQLAKNVKAGAPYIDREHDNYLAFQHRQGEKTPDFLREFKP